MGKLGKTSVKVWRKANESFANSYGRSLEAVTYDPFCYVAVLVGNLILRMSVTTVPFYLEDSSVAKVFH